MKIRKNGRAVLAALGLLFPVAAAAQESAPVPAIAKPPAEPTGPVKEFVSHLRLRAREHFEFNSIRYGSDRPHQNYFGLADTVNLWYEKPFEWAFGLGAGILPGNPMHGQPAPIGVAPKPDIWHAGFEFKYFFHDVGGVRLPGLFGRLGATANILDTRSTRGNILGGGYYVGVGYEFLVWKIGLAPEVAFRHVIYQEHVREYSFTPSFGLHFYWGDTAKPYLEKYRQE